MPRFDRYILRLLLGAFGFFALTLVGVYWINRAVGLFDQLIGSGQTALVFLEFSALTLPSVIKILLPVAAFIGTVYAGNRLLSDSELVVMQATGFSPFRLARPVALFGLIVVAMMLVLSHVLVPMARSAAAAQRSEMSENITAHFLQDGQFTHPSPGVTLYIRDISDRGELQDLYLADDRQAQARTSYTANRALFLRGPSGPKLLMVGGMVQVLDRRTGNLSVTRFTDFTYDLGAVLTKPGRSGRGADEVPTAELLRAGPDLAAETGETIGALTYEAHARFAEPLMALTATLIGFAALMQGGNSRMGNWRQISLAVMLLIAIQGLTTFAASRGPRIEGGYLLAYLGPTLGIVLALGLLAWAGRSRAPSRPAAPREVAA